MPPKRPADEHCSAQANPHVWPGRGDRAGTEIREWCETTKHCYQCVRNFHVRQNSGKRAREEEEGEGEGADEVAYTLPKRKKGKRAMTRLHPAGAGAAAAAPTGAGARRRPDNPDSPFSATYDSATYDEHLETQGQLDLIAREKVEEETRRLKAAALLHLDGRILWSQQERSNYHFWV